MIRNSFLGKVVGLALGISALFISGSASAEKLDLSEGTLTSAGMAALKYQSANLATYSGQNWNMGVAFDFGYFVVDNLALAVEVAAGGKFTTGDDLTRNFRLGINLMYVFDTDSVVRPYISLGGFGAWGPGVSTTATLPANLGWSAGIKPALGLLVGLNQHVALDFGLSGMIDFPITRNGTTSIDAGIGYLGVRGFF